MKTSLALIAAIAASSFATASDRYMSSALINDWSFGSGHPAMLMLDFDGQPAQEKSTFVPSPNFSVMAPLPGAAKSVGIDSGGNSSATRFFVTSPSFGRDSSISGSSRFGVQGRSILIEGDMSLRLGEYTLSVEGAFGAAKTRGTTWGEHVLRASGSTHKGRAVLGRSIAGSYFVAAVIENARQRETLDIGFGTQDGWYRTDATLVGLMVGWSEWNLRGRGQMASVEMLRASVAMDHLSQRFQPIQSTPSYFWGNEIIRPGDATVVLRANYRAQLGKISVGATGQWANGDLPVTAQFDASAVSPLLRFGAARAERGAGVQVEYVHRLSDTSSLVASSSHVFLAPQVERYASEPATYSRIGSAYVGWRGHVDALTIEIGYAIKLLDNSDGPTWSDRYPARILSQSVAANRVVFSGSVQF